MIIMCVTEDGQERYAPPPGQHTHDVHTISQIVLLSIIMTAASERDMVQLLLLCPGYVHRRK